MKITIIIRKWCATLLLMALPLLSWSAPYYIDHEGFSYYGVIGRELSVIGCSLSGDVVVPSKIICNDLEYDVTAISGGFTDHQDLTSVTISNGITVIGTSAFSGCSNLREVNLPSTSLVEIGSSAFSKCLSLKSITIPNSVETIGNGAFSGSGLTSISIPNSVTKIEGAFMDCADLASVKIGSGLTTIGASTFQNCTSLSSIIIPKNITRIEGSAFSGCSGLVTMTIPESVTYIGTSVFQDCTGRLNINCNIPGPVHYDLGVFYGAKFTELVMGDSVKSIGWNAFGYDGNTFLTSVTFGKNVETIGNNAFSGCSSLTSITIPNSVKTIGNQVFFRCTGLKTVTIGSGLETMGGGVFQECTALQSASIRSGSIGSSAFASCTNLVNLTLGDGVTSIGSSAFNSCSSLSVVDIPSSVNSIGSTAFYECSGLTSFTIPNSVTSIGEWAFGYCTGKAYINRNITTNNGNPYAGARFTEVFVGDGVTEIGNDAFREMSTLTSISLPDGLLTIGNNAFFSCNGLTSVKIPASVTSIGSQAFCNSKQMNLAQGSVLSCEIGNEAFAGCTKLTAVTFGPNVGNIGTSAFARCEALASVSVPKGVTKMKTIGQYAFSECSQMGAFDFPSCVDSIGYGAFEKCYSLTLVNLPEGLRTIEGSAFFGCSGVTSVTIPKSVQTMGSNIFNGCQGTAYIYCNLPGYSEWSSPFTAARFSSIVLGENVTEISDWFFYQCQQLRNVTVERTTPVEIGGAVFPYRSSSTLYCPNGGKYKYKEADYWKEFQNIVAPQYKLTYEVDGKVYKTDSIDFEAPLVAIEGPTKEGYTFSGWSEIPKTMPANDVVITGAFKVNKYLLTYKVDDEIVKSDSIVYNTTLTPEAEPTKDGYTFSGWSEIPATMPAQDVVVTGTFKVNKYLLTYKVDDEIFKSDSIVYNATINPETAPTKEGYTFSGWSEIPATMPAQDVVVTGTFKVNKYLLTYKVDDEIVKSDSIVYNTAITPEAEPTKEGYTFSGWSEIPETMPAEDVVVTGSFKINKYLLTYKVDNEVFKSDSIVYNSALTAIEAPTKEGYTFSGWSEIPETMPANDVIVTGSFSINKYLLTYKVDDEVVKSDSIVYNTSLTAIAEPTKEGYTFSGWSWIPNKMPAEDVVVTGSFKANKYLLTYKVDNEIFKSDSIVFNSALTAIAEPTKEGYTFSGWSEIPDSMPAQDVLVTGTFKINKYLLTYKVDDEVFKSDSIVYNSSLTPIAEPIKEGYTFSGWSEIPATMPANDVVITGAFKVNKYLLTYKVDGEIVKSDSIVYNAAITPEAEPTKEGYTFSGWSEIPETMPAKDVVVTGTFKINKYLLTYKVDDEIVKSDSIVYNTAITPEAEPTKEGYTFSGWSEIPETMPAEDVIVTGTFKINKYLLTYKVDDEVFKSDSIVYNTAITPEANPTKEGYTFSGWSEIPETMPAKDVLVTGTFSINSYKLTYMIDDKVYKDTVYEYSATIVPEPMPEGNYVTFEWIDLPETMPAHDVVVHASYTTGIREMILAKPQDVQIYSPNGKKLNKLQKGLNIVVMSNGKTQKVVVK